jgi:hypothetical protein
MKLLIHNDGVLFEKILSDINSFRPLLNTFLSAYNSLEIGELTNDTFKYALDDQGTTVIESYKNSLINNSASLVLKQLIWKEADPIINHFRTALSNLLNYCVPVGGAYTRSTLTLHSITLNEGQFGISEAEKVNILENYCQTYISTEEEKAFYTSLTAAKHALEKVFGDIATLQLERHLQSFEGLGQFFVMNGSRIEIKPDSVKWATTAAVKAKAMHARSVEWHERQSTNDAKAKENIHSNANALILDDE